MAARRNKSGQFTKSKPRRRTMSKTTQPRRSRRKPAVSAFKVAEQVVVANAITMGLFNSNLKDFMTGQMNGQYKAGADGSFRLTLPELLGIAGRGGLGGTYGSGYNLQSVLTKNIKDNGMQTLGTVVLAPVAFKMARKFLSKPIINPANRILRSVGITEVKV